MNLRSISSSVDVVGFSIVSRDYAALIGSGVEIPASTGSGDFTTSPLGSFVGVVEEPERNDKLGIFLKTNNEMREKHTTR